MTDLYNNCENFSVINLIIQEEYKVQDGLIIKQENMSIRNN